MKCKHCGDNIRWTEMTGWVHGRNGEGYRMLCTLPSLKWPNTDMATPRDEDMEWLTKPFSGR